MTTPCLWYRWHSRPWPGDEMIAIALAVPIDVEDRLAVELSRHGHSVAARCDNAAELSRAIADRRLDVAIVAANPRYLTERLLAESDSAGVRVVGLVASDADRRHAASVGLLETVDEEADWPRLEALVIGPVGSPTPRSDGPRGQVIAVWGPAGAPGRTSVAIAIAAELAAEGFSVVLADADTHSGAVAPALGLLDESPGFAAACRLAGADSLDTAELERIGQRYLSGHGSFWVLTGIGRPSRWPELSGDRVTDTLRRCRTWVDYVVVDTSSSLESDEEISSDLFAPRRNASTIAALREADRVIAVGSADPVGLSRFLRAHVDLMETITTDRVHVVMNRIRAGAIGLNPQAQVRQTLQRFGGILSPVLVPHDQAAFDAAVLEGRTLLDVAPRSAARTALRRFVQAALLPAPVAAVRSRRALHRRTAVAPS